MGSRSQSEDQSTFDPNYSPPNTVDFATQEVLAALAAEAEVGDHIASQEAGVTHADGKQKGSRKRLISLVDDTDDSDVEISQPTQKTKPRRQTSFGTATGKPMLQSTIDGGVGSSAQVCSKGKMKKSMLAVLQFYKVDGSGKVQRLRKECPSVSCGPGTFMASHFDRHYCGKCGTTYVFKKPDEE
ncbi:hypothetical protein HID58_034926 [Brassica napus]|uniref:Small ribosomal subunit protein eS31 domain-containing protein n=1 Tax=Brassica napus TaxID=3708 RepID=A0ABQ8C554_BRANA|nr:hypothetical protein HID58_034926 [Brassica napus]